MKTLTLITTILGLSAVTNGCGSQSSLERLGYTTRKPRIALPSPTPLQPYLKADYEISFLAGGTTRVSQLLGRNKVVVVNFWATWCGPCRREIPELTSLDREFANRGVEIVGLSVEAPEENAELVKAFATQYSMNYRIGFTSSRMFLAFNGATSPDTIPQTFVFNRDGNLTLHVRGYRPDFREMVKTSIEGAL